MSALTVHAANGSVIGHYPDFAPGTALRVLPAIVSAQFPTDRRIVDDTWSFVGPTRHPEYATIRHDRDHVTTAMERNRLRERRR